MVSRLTIRVTTLRIPLIRRRILLSPRRFHRTLHRSRIGTSSRRSIRLPRRRPAGRNRTPPIATGTRRHPSAPRPPSSLFRPLHSQQARPSNSSSYDAPPSDAPFAAPSHHEPAGMPSPPFHLASGRAPSPPPLDEYYDDAPQGGRRKGLITVAAVFMLAVVGTAGAFGYRTWFGGPSVKPAPAVIRASAEPAKVAPPAPAVDPNANKISYDRFGDRGQNEKVVLREEKPVDIRDATRTGSAMSAGAAAQSASCRGHAQRRHAAERADRSQEGAHRDDPSGCAGQFHRAPADGDAAGTGRARCGKPPLRAVQRAARSRQSRIAAAAGPRRGGPADAAICGPSGASADFGQRAAVAGS